MAAEDVTGRPCQRRLHCIRRSSTSSRSLIVHLVLLLCLPTSTWSLPVPVQTEAVDYLQRYGYLEPSVQAVLSDRRANSAVDLSSAIKRFQRFAGLRETGVIDSGTRSVMSLSRCGLPDTDTDRDGGPHRRRKRYVIAGPPWPSRNLKYHFRNFTRHLTPSVVRSVVRQAVQLWSAAAPLTISETQVSSDADIRVQYSRRQHGDNFPFDSEGGVLAHAFYPHSGALAGEIHFDDDERWTHDDRRGTSLKQVATHEIGHALGLGHSNEPGSVMSPFYNGYSAQFRLGNDDILGIRKLYATLGGQESSTAVTTADVTPTSRPGIQLCRDATVDAATAFSGTTYFFKGTSYIVVDNSTGVPTIRDGYPRPLTADWPSLGTIDRLDAALYVAAQSNDAAHLYVFKGDRYWRYSSWPVTNQLDTGYPRLISDGFPGVPSDLDAAFVWGKRHHIYFVKGSQYYRYTRKLGVHSDYPKPVSLWRGLPSAASISAAFQAANSATYFFTGQHFYRFNDVAFNVDNRQPLSIAEHWFGCNQPAAGRQ